MISIFCTLPNGLYWNGYSSPSSPCLKNGSNSVDATDWGAAKASNPTLAALVASSVLIEG